MQHIKEFIQLGNTEKAIERLRAMAGDEFEKEAIHLASRYEYLTREKIRGTLDPDDYARALQQINAGILDLVTRMERPASGNTGQNAEKHSGFYRYRRYALAAVLFAVLAVILFVLANREEKTYYFNVTASRNVPLEITNALDSLRTASENVQDISVNADYFWVILLGRDRAMWSKDIPPFLDERLREVYNQHRHTIRQVALGPHARWVLLFNENDYWVYPDVRDTLRMYLDDGAWRRNGALKQVIFGPGQDEFVVLSGDGFFAYSNIPFELLNCLKNNPDLRSVSIGPKDEWIAITGSGDAISGSGVDGELINTLERLKKENRGIRRVCLLKNKGWIVLTD